MEYRKVQTSDGEDLFQYFLALSDETKSRYGPHPFDRSTCSQIASRCYRDYQSYIGKSDENIVAYTVIKPGYIEGDHDRYRNYSVDLDPHVDYTLAPSVADEFQSKGVGSQLFDLVRNQIIDSGGRKIILWGGVQSSNHKAVNFYQKFGFKTLGEFYDHNGKNFDMVMYLMR